MRLDEMLASVGLSGDDNETVSIGKAAMEEAKKALAKANAEKYTKVATGQLETLSSHHSTLLCQVKDYRKCLEESITRLKKFDRSYKYAEETGNLVPAIHAYGGYRGVERFCMSLGVECPPMDSPLMQVPEAWKPAETKAS